MESSATTGWPRWRRLALLLALAPGVVACGEHPALKIAGADPESGKAAIERYGCIACHAIPGIAGQAGNVGPPLQGIGQRAYLGGILANTPQEMVRWLRNPPAADPKTAMPALGLSEAEAQDIAAYLYTLR